MNWFKELTNFIKSKLLTGNTNYPKAIIPVPGYKLSLDFDLIETELILLVRRSNQSYAETYDEDGCLKEQAISPIEMPNMSLNLLGAKFKIKHIDYIQKKHAADPWDGKRVEISEIIKDIENKGSSIPIFIRHSDINNKSFPYQRPKEQLSQPQILLLESLGYNLNQTSALGLVPLEGSTKITHTPTMSNYWHVELKMMQSDGSEIIRKNASSAWGGKAAQSVLDIITNSAFSDIREAERSYNITKKDYIG